MDASPSAALVSTPLSLPFAITLGPSPMPSSSFHLSVEVELYSSIISANVGRQKTRWELLENANAAVATKKVKVWTEFC
jgi:hypothetical protein